MSCPLPSVTTVGIGPKCAASTKPLPLTRHTSTASALHSRAALSAIVSKTDCRSDGELAIMRRISLVAACCSAASRISRPCAAIVFFSFETESAEDAARGFGLVFFAAFLVVLAIRAKDSVVFAVADDSPQRHGVHRVRNIF